MHLKAMGGISVDCAKEPVNSIKQMFVDYAQASHIRNGETPVRRAVFRKLHGVAYGTFRIRADIESRLKVGVFAGSEYPVWVRFSSDTGPAASDYKTTVGIGIKLFDMKLPKIFGRPDDPTFDFIMQNIDVFFVDNAAEMCRFTQASLNGQAQQYLDQHPVTARILDRMEQPIASVLASPYWSCIPFAFGDGPNPAFCKYSLEPTIAVDAPTSAPDDPNYLGTDLRARLLEGDANFKFTLQFSLNPDTMPLDKATVPWDSPSIVVADLTLPKQDIAARGQADYGENLSMNVWRVSREHKPQGSIADARLVAYEASAVVRHAINGIPHGEPIEARAQGLEPVPENTIVRAAIHPGIGIARIGDSKTGYFVGPEVPAPQPQAARYYRDETGAIKRQVARFRIYGYNAAGVPVAELTPDNATIEWTAHLVNKKAQWYQFQCALDIPEAVKTTVPKRNANIEDRTTLVIDPGPRSISGKSTSGPAYRFDSGEFKGTVVPLGEIRTDENGCLLVFGGTGKSASPSGAPVYRPADPKSFNNADDWYDDTSDGPISAKVSIGGKVIDVDPAWVVVAPPNYAPDIISWRTMYDQLCDVYVANGLMPPPTKVSFSNDVLPILQRQSNLQWVNKGYAAMYGKGCPWDFNDPDLIAKLAEAPSKPRSRNDAFGELRRSVLNAFRPPAPTVSEPVVWPHVWPWIYGDAFGSFPADGPGNMLTMTTLQTAILNHWADGNFINDWPAAPPPDRLDNVPLAEQPATLDKAALHFCLADTFHPGCEMTWPMRHGSMYIKPFRFRLRAPEAPERDYGPNLDQITALEVDGPVYAQGPGDITRWMAVPWQGDTAFCRSGYDPEYDPYLPTFWAARVPNQVLTEEDYAIVIDTSLPREQRLAAFSRREPWTRAIDVEHGADVAATMENMIAKFGTLGIVEARAGVANDPDIPEVIFVETIPESPTKNRALFATQLRMDRPLTRIEQAGWASEAQLNAFRAVRVRIE